MVDFSNPDTLEALQGTWPDYLRLLQGEPDGFEACWDVFRQQIGQTLGVRPQDAAVEDLAANFHIKMMQAIQTRLAEGERLALKKAYFQRAARYFTFDHLRQQGRLSKYEAPPAVEPPSPHPSPEEKLRDAELGRRAQAFWLSCAETAGPKALAAVEERLAQWADPSAAPSPSPSHKKAVQRGLLKTQQEAARRLIAAEAERRWGPGVGSALLTVARARANRRRAEAERLKPEQEIAHFLEEVSRVPLTLIHEAPALLGVHLSELRSLVAVVSEVAQTCRDRLPKVHWRSAATSVTLVENTGQDG